MAGVIKKTFRAVVAAVATILLLSALAHAAFIYMGGYWEDIAVLNRISGPKRFKQFVADPIPEEIHELKGGYSGFPQGTIRTYFGYSGDFSDTEFLDEWEKMQDYPFGQQFAWYLTDTDVAAVYRKKHYESYMYLIIDEQDSKGVLYLP
jgi:hypothetical protein